MAQSPPDLSRRRLVIFDLDGTLIDSAADIQAALNRMLAHYGRAEVSLDTARQMIGDGSRVLVHRALQIGADRPDVGAVDEAAAYALFIDLYEKEAASLTKIYPDVPETLEALYKAGSTLAICTNKPQRVTTAVLDALDLARFFKKVVTGDAQPFHKPDPRMILPILEELGFARDQTVYVGDSEVDAETATAAELDLILMSYGYLRKPLAELTYAVLLDRFGDLVPLLKAAG